MFQLSSSAQKIKCQIPQSKSDTKKVKFAYQSVRRKDYLDAMATNMLNIRKDSEKEILNNKKKLLDYVNVPFIALTIRQKETLILRKNPFFYFGQIK